MSEFKLDFTIVSKTNPAIMADRKTTYGIKFDDEENAELMATEFEGKKIRGTFKEAKKDQKRSLNANAYLWTLVGKLATKMRLTKSEVYQREIREAGVSEVISISENALQTFTDAFTGNSLGAQVEEVGYHDGYVDLICYKGSSEYTTEEMARLIDAVVYECKNNGIQVLSDSELDLLKRQWK